MAFDFKKEFKKFYRPSEKPEIIEIPKMNFIAVRGKGNPNEKEGEYQKAVGEFWNKFWKELSKDFSDNRRYIYDFEEYITKDNYEISGESYENMEIHIYISIK